MSMVETNKFDVEGTHFVKPTTSITGARVVEFDFNEHPNAYDGHIVIWGNAEIGSQRVLGFAEDRLLANEQVILFTFAPSVFGLQDHFPNLIRFGNGAHQIKLEEFDGTALSTYAAKTQESMIICLNGMLPDDASGLVSKFLEGMVQNAQMHRVNMIFDRLDEILPRLRHHDRPLASIMRSILKRPETGFRVIASAVSPKEAPIEVNINSTTFIACRSSLGRNVEAIDQELTFRKRERSILMHSTSPHGIHNIHDLHQWVWPCGLAMDGMPFYSEMKPLQFITPNSPGPVKGTRKAEKGLVKKLLAARKDREKSSSNKAPAARMRALKASKGKKLAYESITTGIANTVMNMIDERTLGENGAYVNHEDRANLIQHDTYITQASSWIGRNQIGIKPLATINVVGAAYHCAMRENPVMADTFFSAMISADSDDAIISKAQTRLKNDKIERRSQERFDIILNAWDEFNGTAGSAISAPSAANDDVALGKAI